MSRLYVNGVVFSYRIRIACSTLGIVWVATAAWSTCSVQLYIYIHSCMQKRLSKNGWSFVELIAQNEATTYI
eukprot:COSAG06_NODE_414_length_16033_cov_67.366717_5_plen_72_part_00